MKANVVGNLEQQPLTAVGSDDPSISSPLKNATLTASQGPRHATDSEMREENGDLRDEIVRLQEENRALRGQVAETERLFKEFFHEKTPKQPASDSRPPVAPIKRSTSVIKTESECFQAMRRHLSKAKDNVVWKPLQAFALLFALFGGAFFTIFNIPDSPGLAILDTIMMGVTIFFIFETTVFFVCDGQYRWSFYFWMDILGTLSMAFEISFLLGAIGSVHTVVLRAARTAKLGARVGRLLKVLKFVLRQPDLEEVSKAAVLSQNLLWALSTRVAVLTIALVMVLPLFSFPLFPTEDLSMQLWIQRLEEVYTWAIQPQNSSSLFGASMQHLMSFYQDYNYFPYKVEGFDYVPVGNVQVGVEGQAALLGKSEPKRKANKVEYEVADCRYIRDACNNANKATVHFDMTHPNQIDAAMGIVLIVFVIGLMIIMTFELNRVLEQLLIRPLERMLNTVRVYASNLCLKFAEANGDDDDDDDISQKVSELEMLEAVLQKLARIASLHMKKNEVSAMELANMSHSDKAILVDMMNATVNPTMRMGPAMSVKPPKRAKSHKIAIHTWELDVLQQDRVGLQELVQHIFFTSELGHAEDFVDSGIFAKFHEVVEAGYKDLPYHCYIHACDILHDVFRIMNITIGKRWLTAIDQYALMVAALCHDIGHMGRTNAFLVETKHELALLYNDKAPLENMHCSTLFNICNKAETDAFGKTKQEDRKTARKICVGAILHTDNANHFEMVQDVSHAYEMCENICEDQAEQSAEERLTDEYCSDVLTKNKMMWLFLFLHFSDIANSLKPWKICSAWAARVLDEFFAQGDEEKRLAIPVGMLNDRDKVNRPGSQHGFINFLVAPLVTITVRVFPMLHELHSQMSANLEQWRDTWVQDASPPAEEITKKDEDVKRIKDMSQTLWERINLTPMRVKSLRKGNSSLV